MLHPPVTGFCHPESDVAVIAHRGAGYLAPENSLEAVRRGLELGVPAIEFDVAVTGDGVPIAVHQWTAIPDFHESVLRHEDWNPGGGWTGSHSYRRIRTLAAGSGFSPDFARVRIPRLDDLLALDWGARSAVIDMVDPSYWSNAPEPVQSGEIRRLADAAVPLIEAFTVGGKSAMITSFSTPLLRIIQERLPHVPRIKAVWTDVIGRVDEVVRSAAESGARALSVADRMVLDDPSWVRKAHAAGLSCFAYAVTPLRKKDRTADRPHENPDIWKRLIQCGIDALITDYPKEVLGLVREK